MKRRKQSSVTHRTLKKLRDEGWLAAVVEKWNPHVRIRQDLWGFMDVIAIRGDESLAVQCTSGDHVSNRINKIRQHPNAAIWAASDTRKIVVHGWRKVGARGKRKLWECRVEPVLGLRVCDTIQDASPTIKTGCTPSRSE